MNFRNKANHQEPTQQNCNYIIMSWPKNITKHHITITWWPKSIKKHKKHQKTSLSIKVIFFDHFWSNLMFFIYLCFFFCSEAPPDLSTFLIDFDRFCDEIWCFFLCFFMFFDVFYVFWSFSKIRKRTPKRFPNNNFWSLLITFDHFWSLLIKIDQNL